MPNRCPNCRSDDVFVKKFGFGETTMHEHLCRLCDRFEWRTSAAPDFSDWSEAWSTGVRTPVEKPVAGHDEMRKRRSKRSKPTPVLPRPAVRPPLPDPRVGHDVNGRPLSHYFAAVCAEPHDDAPRFAYADAIAHAWPGRAERLRADILRGQFRRGPVPEEVLARIRAAPDELLLRDGWGDYIVPYARPRPKEGGGWLFDRGFVAHLRTEPALVVDPANGVFSLAPIEHLALVSGVELRAALASPKLAQLKTLDLEGVGLEDEDLLRLGEDGVLASCERLLLSSNRITERGVRTLLDSKTIRGIPDVSMSGNPCDPTMQYSWDCHGTIADKWLPDIGRAAEQRYGRIGWLHPLDGS